MTDRLAAARAQRQQAQSHEMTNLQPSYGAQNGGQNGSTDPMTNFYTEVSSVSDAITQFNGNVARISDLHNRTLNSTDENASHQNAAALDELVEQTRQLSASLKGRIQALAQFPVTRPQDQSIRKNQTATVRTRFVEVLQNYQNVERDYRARYKQRVERQFKIVKPDATPEEITAVVNDLDGSGGQIFTQALSTSTRYGESRMAYREVQDRHQEMLRIERTLEELAQLFNDMSILVEQQDEAINNIELTAGKVEDDTEQGVKQVEIGVKHARAARRKRWICFWITLVVLAIVAIVVAVVVTQQVNKNKSNNNNNGS